MTPAFKLYIAGWTLLCILAVVLFLRSPGSFTIGRRAYWHFLGEPWKLATFVAGTALLTLMAPYTGDPTWDYPDALFMSVLCFTTAPWVTGVLFARVKGEVSWPETYVAVCAWLFSASWSYDIYLVWRDGAYPITWLVSLFASSVLYFSGGLFWNLEWRRGRGVIFSFMSEGWPTRPTENSWFRLMGYAAILAAPALAAVLVFLL